MVHRGAQPRVGNAAAEFAARLTAVMSYRGVGVVELAKRAKLGRNATGRHVKPKGAARPPSARIRRKYEQALGLPPLALEAGSAADVLALLQIAPQRVSGPQVDPLSGMSGELGDALRFVRAQLEGYRASGRPVPVSVVISWLSELESAASAAAQSLEPAPPVSGSGSALAARPRGVASDR